MTNKTRFLGRSTFCQQSLTWPNVQPTVVISIRHYMSQKLPLNNPYLSSPQYSYSRASLPRRRRALSGSSSQKCASRKTIHLSVTSWKESRTTLVADATVSEAASTWQLRSYSGQNPCRFDQTRRRRRPWRCQGDS